MYRTLTFLGAALLGACGENECVGVDANGDGSQDPEFAYACMDILPSVGCCVAADNTRHRFTMDPIGVSPGAACKRIGERSLDGTLEGVTTCDVEACREYEADPCNAPYSTGCREIFDGIGEAAADFPGFTCVAE